MRRKRLKIKILKFLGLRRKKEVIPLKDSIRPRKVKSYYPCEWKAPIKRKLSTGEEITMLPIDSLVSTHQALENWKKELL
jgi:hypothetical protein